MKIIFPILIFLYMLAQPLSGPLHAADNAPKTLKYTGKFDDYDNGYGKEAPLKIIRSESPDGYDLEVYYNDTLKFISISDIIYSIDTEQKTYSRINPKDQRQSSLITAIDRFWGHDPEEMVSMFNRDDYHLYDASDSACRLMYQKRLENGEDTARGLCPVGMKEKPMKPGEYSFDRQTVTIELTRLPAFMTSNYRIEIGIMDNVDSCEVYYPDFRRITFYDNVNRYKRTGFLTLYRKLEVDGKTIEGWVDILRSDCWVYSATTDKIENLPYKKITLPEGYLPRSDMESGNF